MLNKEIANIIINFILPLRSKNSDDYTFSAYGINRVSEKSMIELALLRKYELLTAQECKVIVAKLWHEWSGRTIVQIIQQDKIIRSTSNLKKIVEDVIDGEAKAVLEYKGGKAPALQHLVGCVIKRSGKGTNGKEVKQLLEEMLNKY